MEIGKEYRIVLPEDKFATIKFKKSLMKPGVGIINQGLADFSLREVFGWYCEVLCRIEKTKFNGLPTDAELQTLYEFEDILNGMVKGPDADHPNGLFVGHLICDGVMKLMWMVNNPEEVNNKFQSYIQSDSYLRRFQYCMEPDPEWKSIQHFL